MNRAAAARIIRNGKIIAAFRRGNSLAALAERFRICLLDVEAVVTTWQSDPITFEADLLTAIGVRQTVSLQAYGGLGTYRPFAGDDERIRILGIQVGLLRQEAELLRDLGLGPDAHDWEARGQEKAGDLTTRKSPPNPT